MLCFSGLAVVLSIRSKIIGFVKVVGVWSFDISMFFGNVLILIIFVFDFCLMEKKVSRVYWKGGYFRLGSGV